MKKALSKHIHSYLILSSFIKKKQIHCAESNIILCSIIELKNFVLSSTF